MSATLVLGAIGVMIGLLIVGYILSRLLAVVMYRGSLVEGDAEPGPEEGPSLVDTVMLSGSLVATGMCGGLIGLLRFRSGMRVDVYPAGIVLKPLMMPAMVLLREEIVSVRSREQSIVKGVEIVHRSPRITSAVRLDCREDTELHAALLAIAPSEVAEP